MQVALVILCLGVGFFFSFSFFEKEMTQSPHPHQRLWCSKLNVNRPDGLAQSVLFTSASVDPWCVIGGLPFA